VSLGVLLAIWIMLRAKKKLMLTDKPVSIYVLSIYANCFWNETIA